MRPSAGSHLALITAHHPGLVTIRRRGDSRLAVTWPEPHFSEFYCHFAMGERRASIDALHILRSRTHSAQAVRG